MNKCIIVSIAIILCASTVFAADFSPTLLKLSADKVIQYDFDGSELDIPVTVSGNAAGIIFLVFTKGKADEVASVQNGFLGWHYMNKIDTCVYYSSLKSVQTGTSLISWDGKDQDGSVVPAGEYTYYMWAFDNQSPKQLMSQYIPYDRYAQIQEVDEKGIPLAEPIWYTPSIRWRIGSDPMDSTMVESTDVNLAQDWERTGSALLHPTDFNYYYLRVVNNVTETGSIQKLKWVPGGTAVIQEGFGENGFAETFQGSPGSSSIGVTTNGEYLYTSDRYALEAKPNSEFYIYDFDGYQLDVVDLTGWWSSQEDFDAGVMYNGGPSYAHIRDGLIFWNHFGSCMAQMVDPDGYLESGDTADFFKWTNDNGDYVLDHNFEETSARPWVCFDYNVGPYAYTLHTDAKHFTVANAYDVGAVSFALLAPDGTGLGYLSYAGETAGWKRGTWFVDADTPADGIYCDNMQTGGTHYDWDKEKVDLATYFIGHDAISGVITNAVAVADNAPAAFTVEQNAPNPFNPSTTIRFSLAGAGDVSVSVYNVAGQKVATLAGGFMEAGHHSVAWDASGFSAGVYFYTVESGGFTKTMKMTLLK